MEAAAHHEIAELRLKSGELSFKARIGEVEQEVWLRTNSGVVPTADAVLSACLMPAMKFGGALSLPAPVSPRILRTQPEFQAIQRAWSRDWGFGEPPLKEVEVRAEVRKPALGSPPPGRVAALFSGGIDSWSTVLTHPELTDLIFVRGFDLLPGTPQRVRLGDEIEVRLGTAARDMGLHLHVVETNLRELSDPLVRWDAYYSCAAVSVALFMAPLFERVLIASETDHEGQAPIGSGRMVDQLWSTERLEIVDDGGRYNRVERTRRVAEHPVAQRTLRVCWENRDNLYNCGGCRKCLMTLVTLEALGMRDRVTTFPPRFDLEAIASTKLPRRSSLHLWEDILDEVRAAARADLEPAVEAVVSNARRSLGLPSGCRRRKAPGPPATVRIAAIVPVWRQSRYMAAAVRSALAQTIDVGIGVVIVNDGCPEPASDRIGQALRDADPDRVSYLRQANRGVSAARNAGIARAFARWPHIEAIFPLDADNMLSPETLAKLRARLAARPDAAWASPVLEFFGDEEGEWSMPEPFLTYRQLFGNQSDAGSLIRRSVFEAGIEFEEAMPGGFEDWEFFLRAALAGFRGTQAGWCGFRYRRRANSLLARAQREAGKLETGIRRLHAEAYRPESLARLEHAEAPRFALVRCDAGDALLTAACDLEPHRLALRDLLRPRQVGGDASLAEVHVPTVTVLTRAATLDCLAAENLLATVLLRLQIALHKDTIVGLRLERERSAIGGRPRRHDRAPAAPAALVLRTRTLADFLLDEARLEAGAFVDVQVGRRTRPLSEPLLQAAVDEMRTGLKPGGALIAEGSQAQFFEHLHLDLLATSAPTTETGTVGADLKRAVAA